VTMALADALVGKRVVIVGGGGTGIGRATTEAVGRAGAAGVVIVGRDRQRTDGAAAAIASESCRAIGITGDVQSSADTERVVAQARTALGGIDVLMTVVGGMGMYAPWTPLDETTEDNWDLVFDVNVNYVFRYVRGCIKVFLEQGEGGAIVSVGAIAGFTATPMAVAYGAAKAGLISLAKSVTAEYGRRGIRMNVLNCGHIANEAGHKALGQGVDVSVVPMGRSGRPEEVANLAVFFASPLASYVSGQAIAIDGGVTCRAPLRMPNSDSSMAG